MGRRYDDDDNCTDENHERKVSLVGGKGITGTGCAVATAFS